jgi:hypothetical protein
MRDVGMHQRIGEEGPEIGAPASGQQPIGEHGGVVARRHEGERPDQNAVGILRQHILAHEMHEAEDHKHHDDDRRNVEDRFAPLVQTSP